METVKIIALFIIGLACLGACMLSVSKIGEKTFESNAERYFSAFVFLLASGFCIYEIIIILEVF